MKRLDVLTPAGHAARKLALAALSALDGHQSQRSVCMETQELHRGRLIDHIQLVVSDLAASQAFYKAVFEVLKIPMGGTGEDYF
jgi:catechol-2,3-dioxygenase